MRAFVSLPGAFLVAALAAAACGSSVNGSRPPRETQSVVLERTPNRGIQPQALIDSSGTLHLIYFAGESSAGDIYYVRKDRASHSFSPAVRVNSQAGSAIASGTVRGPQMALGRQGRVHVAWNGSAVAQPQGPGGVPMLYARLNESRTAFEPQRNLISWAGGIDGGGTVAADSNGTVYVAWHAVAMGSDEAHGSVFERRSSDDGLTFERERPISPEGAGTCGCCGMASLVDRTNTLFLLYRSAGLNVNRDIAMLTSRDRGATFSATTLHKWTANACPLTTSSLVETNDGVLAAWETEQQIHFQSLGPTGRPAGVARAPQGSAIRKHPVVARNGAGETLLAWTEGLSWGSGGSLAWQVYDEAGKLTDQAGRADGVPMWGSLAAAVQPDGRFLLFY